RGAEPRPISCVRERRPGDREPQPPDRRAGTHLRAALTVTRATTEGAESPRPYEVVIGIETHVELGTESKMFCGCKAQWFGAPPNTLVCPVCLGLPGALPVPNRRAIELAITAGLALHCETHKYTLVDFNRSGVPLLEIVSDPDLSSAEEAERYVRELRDVLVFAGVSDMRFEQGAGRFDVNVSIRFNEDGKTIWPPQSEIKNLNSYAAMRDAVAYEANRLWEDWQTGGEIRGRTGKITVGWSPERGRTYLQRSKEDVEDYRYFPEPDLVALEPARVTVAALRAALPEMPADRRVRVAAQYGLSDHDARTLVGDRALADYYQAAVKAAPGEPKAIANWVLGELLGALRRNVREVRAAPVAPGQLAAWGVLVRSGQG